MYQKQKLVGHISCIEGWKFYFIFIFFSNEDFHSFSDKMGQFTTTDFIQHMLFSECVLRKILMLIQ